MAWDYTPLNFPSAPAPNVGGAIAGLYDAYLKGQFLTAELADKASAKDLYGQYADSLYGGGGSATPHADALGLGANPPSYTSTALTEPAFPNVPGAYRQAFIQAGQRNGVDPAVLARQARTESGFNPRAVSPAGARGIMQFMPGTAQRFGVDPTNAPQSIEAAGEYMAANQKLFGGNTGLAAAGYNWGEGNVQNWLKSGADPSRMPEETRKYVQSVTGKPVEAWLTGNTATPAGGAPAGGETATVSGLPPRQLLSAMLKNPQTREFGMKLVEQARGTGTKDIPAEIQGYLLAVKQGYQGTFLDYQKVKGNQGNKYGVTPIWGLDEKGNQVLGVTNEAGEFKRLDTPGFSPTPPVTKLDLGTGIQLRSTRSGQQVGETIPKDVAGAAQQGEIGKGLGTREINAPQAKFALDTATNQLDRLGQQAQQIKGMNVEGITGLEGKFFNWPGGQAANTQAQLNTLKSQVAFGVLQAMRDMSKTGGAVGQVSNFEEQMLQDNLAALDRAQSAEQFRAALDKITEFANGSKQRLANAYAQAYGGGGAAPQGKPLVYDPATGDFK